ncbi:recombination mediator RecR [Fibrobacter sp.]|uniref:recombination mediator RecR n=1 Tax=Fibrobacter sp. TaxID=35828 RepID=UPI00388EBF44
MNIEPASLEALIGEFSSLPGIGHKTARRLAYHVLSKSTGDVERFSANLLNAKNKVHPCPRCYAFTDEDLCPVCKAREGAKSICVVEKSSDIIPFERSGIYKGTYFVLGGVISPLDGIGPEHLHLPDLVRRIKDENIEELILALGSSPEADSTALMLDRMLAGINVKRTRLARGIPMGSDLEFVDEVTMLRAFEGRVSL